MVKQTAGCGVFLHSGHGGGRVVQDYYNVSSFRAVVNHFNDTVDPSVHESTVSDNADDFACLVFRQYVTQPKSGSDAGTHADAGVYRFERRQYAQSVTANITSYYTAKITKQFIAFAMRAADTELWRAAFRRGRFWRSIFVQDAADALNIEFAETVHLIFAFYRNIVDVAEFVKYRITFFDNYAAFDAGGEFADTFSRVGVGQSEFQYRSFGCRVQYVLVGYTRGNNTKFSAFVYFGNELAVFVESFDFVQFSAHFAVSDTGHKPESSRCFAGRVRI